MKACAIILAGGKSSRMGTNKALLPIDGTPAVKRMKDRLLTVFDQVIIVTNDPDTYEFLNIPAVSDDFPGKGPLAGVHAGLKFSDFELNFIAACDMPFLSAELAGLLINKASAYDAVVVKEDGKLHPLFAVYKKHLASHAAVCLEQDRLRMTDFLESLNVLYLDRSIIEAELSVKAEDVFFNMNHPQEYEKAKAQIENTRRK